MRAVIERARTAITGLSTRELAEDLIGAAALVAMIWVMFLIAGVL